jgi:hypothetical protein
MEGLTRASHSAPLPSVPRPAPPPSEPEPLRPRPRRLDREDAVACGLLAMLAFILLFVTAPRDGDFWWSDAPRHALNGAFLLDAFKALPWEDPAGFAKSYYAQYPALSILFYPPLFPLLEAPIYGLLGVSHTSAQLAVALHGVLLALGVYALARHWLPPAQAFAGALLFLGVHEVAWWGRQVMLEIPVLAWLAWAAVCYLRYSATRRPAFLYGLTLCALGALYTKQTAAFLAVALAGLVVWDSRGRLWTERRLWVTAALSAAALIPLAVLTLKFGQVNLNAAAGETGRESSRLGLANWLYYPAQLPEQLGWPVLLLALGYPLLARLRPVQRLPKPVERLLWVWLAAGYLFFSLIALKEPRHSVLVLLPLVLFAVAALARGLPERLATPAVLVLAGGQFVHATQVDDPPAIGGYREAAAFIAEAAPPHSLILFSGYRDGSFVFNLRAREDRRDLGVLRSDKLLLKVKVKRELGVEQRGLTREQLSAALDRYGVGYVVNQPNFWNDLAAMQVLQDLLHTDQFAKVGEIPVTGNVPHGDRVLEIYRNLHYRPGATERPPLELLIIDQVI